VCLCVFVCVCVKLLLVLTHRSLCYSKVSPSSNK
jgi:hypothetical protein